MKRDKKREREAFGWTLEHSKCLRNSILFHGLSLEIDQAILHLDLFLTAIHGGGSWEKVREHSEAFEAAGKIKEEPKS